MTNATQNKIVENAQSLFWEKGYEGTSLNDVVNAAGLSKGAFFHYYPNKKSITLVVLEKYAAEQLFRPLQTSMDEAGSIKEGLLAWLEKVFTAYKTKGFKGGCLFGNFALEIADKDDEVREAMKVIFLQWENLLTDYLRSLDQQGKLTMEARQLARLLIASLQGAKMTAKIHKDPIRASREFQAIAQLISVTIRT